MSSSRPYSETEVKQLIAESEATIVRLELQIQEERDNLARLRASIAGVGKLSAELLAEIFLCAVQDSLGNQPRRTSVRHRLTLSQVCSRWRGVSHTTPRLWTGACVENTLRKTPTRGYLTNLKTLVDRSSPFPVPVHLQCRSAKVEIGPIMDLLCAVAPRYAGSD
ncbi:hypothetical protein FB45DRAFT_298029 [Roridomyces roridus]|uniref:F-box domain-containing protein n=1 Tax=Roridomyces roridus TaxID=1738132 RepID=A0AAD7FV78_9AGAR|nr:hypothetical protein FB45DRAFT_298029 [Roridomyces roridus]